MVKRPLVKIQARLGSGALVKAVADACVAAGSTEARASLGKIVPLALRRTKPLLPAKMMRRTTIRYSRRTKMRIWAPRADVVLRVGAQARSVANVARAVSALNRLNDLKMLARARHAISPATRMATTKMTSRAGQFRTP